MSMVGLLNLAKLDLKSITILIRAARVIIVAITMNSLREIPLRNRHSTNANDKTEDRNQIEKDFHDDLVSVAEIVHPEPVRSRIYPIMAGKR